MKKNEILNLVTSISEKFHNINKQSDVELQCEVLHCALLEVYREFTEKEYNDLPLTLRRTLEKLDKSIFQFVSVEYKQTVESLSKFAQETPKAPNRIKTKVKSGIGFIKEEGINI